MSKVLRCNDGVPGCPYETRGASEEEVLGRAAEHATTAHSITEITPELVSKVRRAIHDEDQAAGHAASS